MNLEQYTTFGDTSNQKPILLKFCVVVDAIYKCTLLYCDDDITKCGFKFKKVQFREIQLFVNPNDLLRYFSIFRLLCDDNNKCLIINKRVVYLIY